ncbi:MAG: porin [Rhodoferax sp.]|nr:porin [Rhodoferax sp.]
MKKTLVAIAALAAFGAASAQSSVTLYGRIDASIGNQKTTTGGVTVADPGALISSGAHTGSRWGLKGSEDLGGGLKAIFQLEQGFNIDDGTASSARQFHRGAWVGLDGGFGSLKVGRQYDITHTMYGKYDPFGYSGFSAMGYSFKVGCGTGGSGNCVGRQDNTVMYTSPSMGGFSIAAMWAPGEDKTAAASAGKVYGFMANYSNGPIAAGLGWQSNKANAVGANQARTDTNFGASYDFGMAKAYLQLENGKNKNTVGTGKDSGYGLGVVVPFGAASLTAGYAAEKQKVAGTKVSDAKAFSLLGKYDLSKRTYVYAAYRRGETDPAGANNTTKVTKYGLGLVHNF